MLLSLVANIAVWYQWPFYLSHEVSECVWPLQKPYMSHFFLFLTATCPVFVPCTFSCHLFLSTLCYYPTNILSLSAIESPVASTVCVHRQVCICVYVCISSIHAMPPPCSFLTAGVLGTVAWTHADTSGGGRRGSCPWKRVLWVRLWRRKEKYVRKLGWYLPEPLSNGQGPFISLVLKTSLEYL